MTKRTLIIAFGILVIPLTIMVGSSLAEVAVIKVNYRSASDILPLVETLLSPGGKAAFDRGTNAIIVNDTSESVAKIRELVANMDKPSEQVRIRSDFRKQVFPRAGTSPRRGRSQGIGGPWLQAGAGERECMSAPEKPG